LEGEPGNIDSIVTGTYTSGNYRFRAGLGIEVLELWNGFIADCTRVRYMIKPVVFV